MACFESARESEAPTTGFWETLGCPVSLLSQYFGQFLNREAMPTASFTNATQHRSQKSEWNLKPNKTEKKALF